MKRTLFLSFLFVSQVCTAQRFHLGVFAGGANYLGELNDKLYKRTKLAGGVSLNYEVSDRFMLRGGLTLGKVEGADKYGSSETVKQIRNLSFQSNITEFSLIGELTAFNLYNIRWSPYAFGGLAVYHFNPFITDSGSKIFLQPLSTEGQGLAQYPDRKPYALTQLSIPFGGGIKYNINENVRIGFELGLRRLFTDYLDDVSQSYADEALLLAAKGPVAVKYSYRGDEVPGEAQGYPDVGYPAKDAQRGNPKAKDWMYFTGIHLTFRLGGGYGKTSASGNKSGYGCPRVPM
ncbi:outer membrane beta-barrel protein [Flavisolibacter sp. BT320]|nr:outer membrane beta-barrel protein [Flavisolibacter longurius]